MAEFELSFEPKFKHDDWIDNQSRVQAAGPDGFNQRFHALEADLEKISKVFQTTEAAVNSLAATPAAQEVVVTLTPTLVNTSGAAGTATSGTGTAAPASGWTHTPGQASKVRRAESADGMMSVSLPSGAKVTQLRAIGRNGGGNLRIELNRQALPTDASTPTPNENIARVGGAGEFFDRPEPAQPERAVVDNKRFRYFLTAELNNSNPDATVVLLAFQITCQTG